VYSRHAVHSNCDRMITKYTHGEYCDKLLTLGACNSRAGTAAREYALRYSDRRHPDANVFRRLERRLHETGNVTPKALVNAGRPRTVLSPANEDAITWRSSRDTAPELELSHNRGSSKYFMTINCIHTTTRGAHICFQTIVLYGWNFANGYNINTLRMSSYYITFCGQTKRVLRVRVCSTSTTVTSRHGIILMLSANVDIKPASTFELVSSGTL
jgi:hypothetical protein